jgi:hypothetical protein
MPTPGLLKPLGPRTLGRATEITVQHWKTILPTMPIAPTIMRGALPRQSPNIERFINPRKHHQVIGMCVGRSGSRMIETLVRIPENATADSEPLPAVDISSLWVYWQARQESMRRGVRLAGEGAIVSHSIASVAREGEITANLWVDDEAHERQYSDSLRPTAEMGAFGEAHQVQTYAILDTFDKHLEYLSQGYPIQTGMSVTQGWLQTDSEGRFRDAGSVIGGHATVTIYYNLDTGVVGILNSWPSWGYISDDPRFAATQRYTNIGFMPLEQYEAKFSASNIASGAVEAVVANTVEGFVAERPKIAFNWRSVYGSDDENIA